MNRVLRVARAGASAVLLVGCATQAQTVRLADGPEPVNVRLDPAIPSAGQSVALTVTSPGADSIVLRSGNGLDRYWGTGGSLRARVAADFGDSVPSARYAVRWSGALLSRLKKPAVISVCRQGR